MAKLGYFLLLWANLETGLPRAIRCAREKLGIPDEPLPVGLALRLTAWQDLARADPRNRGRTVIAEDIRKQALALRAIRNTIVHGLQSGNARPEDGLPFITCISAHAQDTAGRCVRFTLDDLECFVQATDACLRGLHDLESFNYRLQQLPHD